jgi:hypothetical protein
MAKKKSNNTLLIILIVIAVILVISLILYFSLFKENYKRKKGRKMNRRKCEEILGGTWKKRKCILPAATTPAVLKSKMKMYDDDPFTKKDPFAIKRKDLNVTGGWFDEDPFAAPKIYPRGYQILPGGEDKEI